MGPRCEGEEASLPVRTPDAPEVVPWATSTDPTEIRLDFCCEIPP